MSVSTKMLLILFLVVAVVADPLEGVELKTPDLP